MTISPAHDLKPNSLIAVDVVVFTLRPEPVERAWQALLVPQGDGSLALPGVLVGPNETFEQAARRAVRDKAGLWVQDWYLEQLATFGDPTRDDRGRVASVAHIALVRSDEAEIDRGGDGEQGEWWPVSAIPWDRLAFDHAAMLTEAVRRVRDKVRYAWLAFKVLPVTFTMSELRAAYAAIRDPDVMRLSTSNFRKLFGRLIEWGVLVPVGARASARGRGRPGDLFRFSGPLTGTWARELPW